jgi:5-methylcytosine-specific restriction endonuclease McrA
MANKWNIPAELEAKIRERDKSCVYCGCIFTDMQFFRKTSRSWEHIFNDDSKVSYENIALCCLGCNASKGSKPLIDWLNSTYCQGKGISIDTVAPIVQEAIRNSR